MASATLPFSRATVYLRNGTQEQYPEDGDAPWAKDITLVGSG
jgi:hypothetical protein